MEQIFALLVVNCPRTVASKFSFLFVASGYDREGGRERSI